MNNESDGVDELDKLYKSGLWKEIEDNFRSFDELIEDADLRDFYKRVIWELVNNRTASLQSDLLSLNSNLLTMAANVDLAVKERDRYKDALYEVHRNSGASQQFIIDIIDNALTK